MPRGHVDGSIAWRIAMAWGMAMGYGSGYRMGCGHGSGVAYLRGVTGKVHFLVETGVAAPHPTNLDFLLV